MDIERLKYVQVCDKQTEQLEEDHVLWNVKKVVKHRVHNGAVQMKCIFLNGDSSWLDMHAIAMQDPVPILRYV